MNKLMSILVATVMVAFSAASFAGSHGGAPKDCKKDDARDVCKKMEEKK